MKRGHYEHGGGPGGGNKRPRGDKFEIRVLVPSKVAGSIIGKGGCNIQKLRNDNNAAVRIPDCPGPERVMTIQTSDADTAVNVLRMSIPFMTEEAVRGGPGSVSGMPEGPQELRLLIHQSIVGGIIGRAGFKIKEIRDASGANIKVYQHCAPHSSDRCVAVSGSVDKLCLALKEVFQVMTSTDIKGMDQPYDPNNFDTYYAGGYGGFGGEMDAGAHFGRSGGRGGVGGGRRGGRGGRDDFRGRFDRNRRGGGGGGGGGYGFQDYDGGYGNEGYGNYGGGGGGGGGGRRGGGGRPFSGYDGRMSSLGGDGPMPSQGPSNDDDGKIDTTQVTIPKDLAGAIIGPGGTRIRKIRSDSKANITIDEPLPGSNERIITISGSDRQIQTAQYLLQQSVREHSGQNVGGGSSSYSVPNAQRY
ncbi:heterogeneous nuclear ribonucleoprotein K-like [Lepeophtheirus salmonis]|uniref:heterogeneous nuclear ribonucleoprotein K-like n=1 Tax=Lepeophtheirus salmonis TaxID=72036 RepID=UPI001AE32BF5|nr:heterogeneous nuclear ribonucleoprotein K-like [Lepeophtheirus salmonis]